MGLTHKVDNGSYHRGHYVPVNFMDICFIYCLSKGIKSWWWIVLKGKFPLSGFRRIMLVLSLKVYSLSKTMLRFRGDVRMDFRFFHLFEVNT